MANSFSTMPVYLDTDTTKALGTNWKGASGGSKYTGGIGIRPTKLIIGSASTTATTPGTVFISDVNNTAQAYFTFEVISTEQTPVEIDLTSGSPGWHDFIATGLTATGTSMQIYYRV
ncbi:MAG: hypothetical protein WB683_05095 [Candidatus Sulfotelmatobacter sp.]